MLTYFLNKTCYSYDFYNVLLNFVYAHRIVIFNTMAFEYIYIKSRKLTLSDYKINDFSKLNSAIWGI